MGGIDIQTLIEEETKTKKKLTSVDIELKQIQKQIDFLYKQRSAEIEFLHKQKSDLESHVELLSKQKEELGKEICCLKVDKDILDRNNLKITRDIQSLNIEKIVLESDIDLLNHRKTTLDAENTRIESLKREKAVLESDIESDKKEKNALRRELELFTKKKEQLQSDIVLLKKDMSTVMLFDVNLSSDDISLSFQDSASVTVSESANTCLNREDIRYSPQSKGKKRRQYQVVDETHRAQWNSIATPMYPSVFKEKDLLIDSIAVLFPHQKKRRTRKGQDTVTPGEKQARGWRSNFTSLFKDVQPSIQINNTGGTNIMNGQRNAVGGKFGKKDKNKLRSDIHLLDKEKSEFPCGIVGAEEKTTKMEKDIKNMNKEKTSLGKNIELLVKHRTRIGSNFELLSREKAITAGDVVLSNKLTLSK